jgi:hypothetical protein
LSCLPPFLPLKLQCNFENKLQGNGNSLIVFDHDKLGQNGWWKDFMETHP